MCLVINGYKVKAQDTNLHWGTSYKLAPAGENSGKQKWYEADEKRGAKGAKGQDLQNSVVNHGEVTHGYRMHREDMVKFGGHNWDDAIGEMVKRK